MKVEILKNEYPIREINIAETEDLLKMDALLLKEQTDVKKSNENYLAVMNLRIEFLAKYFDLLSARLKEHLSVKEISRLVDTIRNYDIDFDETLLQGDGKKKA